MKIQGLAIIFIIIILPISIIIGEYAKTQIYIFKMEQSYNSRLITATHDALKAFQINTFNDATSDIADSKINTIEASVNAFYNSIESSFGLEGYSKEDLQRYIPALVYTMYDGYYIYSPYTNVADISKGEGLEINLDSSKIEYGFKPYVYYSCRYIKGNIDVVINYSLDNYITVQGTIEGSPINETGSISGYLVTLANSKTEEGLFKEGSAEDGNEKYYYNGEEILQEENLTDFLIEKDLTGNIIKKQYKYIKLNGTKYYWNEEEQYIFYLLGGDRIKQVTSTNEDVYKAYTDRIQQNTSAINYYKSAYEFTTWVNANLGDLKPADAKVKLGEQGNRVINSSQGTIFNNKQIEYSGSNFNLHRKEVIRYSIESNLSVAIANFNSYTDAGANFQMPKLKENEWEMLQNEVSIISFLQGINLGGKIYNGYTVVTNNKTEEVVKEESIYISTNDGYYHKINDKHFQNSNFDSNTVNLGILDLDFEIRKDGATGVQYMQKDGLGCYKSIVGQESVDTSYDSIYEYLQKRENVDSKIKQKYYIALARERWGTYKTQNPSNIITILNNMSPANPVEGGDIPPKEETTISVDIIDSDMTYSYKIGASGSVELKKSIIYTLPTMTSEYKVKYAFVKLSDAYSIENVWADSSIIWTECGASGQECNKTVSEEGIWYLLAKVENSIGERIAYDIMSYRVQKEIIDKIAPEIIIENLDGKSNVEPRRYTVEEEYISEKITVNNEENGTDLNPNKFLYIFTQSSSLPNESEGWQNYGGTGATIRKQITAVGNWYLFVKAEDIAGNETIEARMYIISGAEDTCNINIINTDGRTEYKTNGETRQFLLKKEIQVTASKGISEIEYAFSSGANTVNWVAIPGTKSNNMKVIVSGNVFAGDSSRRAISLNVKVTFVDGSVKTFIPAKVWLAGNISSSM